VADDERTASDATVREGPGAPLKRGKALAPGDVVGRYVVGELLGEGGMGVVYAAVDPELARRVALKLVRGGESQARLLREAQAMARLSHPNVVAIYDVGEYDGRVFIAMELVAGENVRRWLRHASRSWRQVLELFRGAGRGLAAAHAAGIVHRDFKLDNILVDRDGRARVTDFGLARAVDEVAEQESEGAGPPSPSPLDTPLTQTGALMGTPAYMAPEQRSLGTPADARTDEFSFCVSLYEALYGERPFHRDGTSREPPAGTRVPAWILRILVRGLAKGPEDRWPSMSALLAALDRDPARVRARIGIAGLAVAVVGALVVMQGRSTGPSCDDGAAVAFGDTWNDVRRDAMHAAFLKTGKPYAEHVFATAVVTLNRAAAEWKAAQIGTCRATRERHEQSEEVMLLRMACLERQRAELAALVDVFGAADGKTVELAAQAAGRLARPTQCDDVRTLGATAAPPADARLRAEVEQLRLQVANANVLVYVGRPRDAIARYEPIAKRAKQIGYRPLEAEASFALGLAYHEQGDVRSALPAYEDAMFAADAGHLDRLAAVTAYRSASCYAAASRFAEARAAVARGRAIVERIGGDRELEGELAYADGDIAMNAGHHEDAVAAYERALPIRIETLGKDHIDTLRVQTNLGASLDELARGPEAIAHDTAAIDGFERTLGSDHPHLIIPLANLGLVYVRVHDLAKAEPLLLRARRIGEALGLASYRTGVASLYLSRLAVEQGRADDAVAYARDAEAAFRASNGDDSEVLGDALVREGAALLVGGKAAAAVDVARRGVALREKANADMPAIAEDLTVLGEAQLAAGHPADALASLERALQLSTSSAHYPGELASTRFAMARALIATKGDRTRATALAKQARDELAPLLYRAKLLAAVDAFLAQ
jgi:tetratricopeptide (TPR) repeat protein/predicted Ser/Thr protein kinase